MSGHRQPIAAPSALLAAAVRVALAAIAGIVGIAALVPLFAASPVLAARSGAIALATAPASPAAATAAPAGAGRGRTMSLTLTSTAFAHLGEMPARYSCEVTGREVSPPLAWGGVPAAAKCLALIVDDPDAPDPRAPQRTWVHWVLYDLPAGAGGLPEGVLPADLPGGTREGRNDWNRAGYGAPCPPIGRHRYFFKLYALDTLLPDLGRPDKGRLEAAMEGHVLAHAELIGTYQKAGRRGSLGELLGR